MKTKTRHDSGNHLQNIPFHIMFNGESSMPLSYMCYSSTGTNPSLCRNIVTAASCSCPHKSSVLSLIFTSNITADYSYCMQPHVSVTLFLGLNCTFFRQIVDRCISYQTDSTNLNHPNDDGCRAAAANVFVASICSLMLHRALQYHRHAPFLVVVHLHHSHFQRPRAQSEQKHSTLRFHAAF